jgi:3-oxoacyl-(acyl-carrier-protein) synthase
MNNAPSANISIRYGLRGPLMTVDAACASAAHSIGYAYNLIRTGMLQVAVAGGADCPFGPGVMAAWCGMRALSERNEDPAGACRPFSADRDGLVLGEGAGVVILESESSALRRGSPLLGEILGYGATGDSYHLTQPTLEGPVRAMRRAIEDAGLAPRDIDHINAHATGTQWNDKTETAAIKEVFGEHAYGVPIVGNKAALGHSISASGAMELIGSLLSVRDGVVPPTINYRVPDPECDLDYVIEGRRAVAVRHVLSNSFAFGGSNAALIVGGYSAAG